jgi:hypothetical protein
MMVVDVSSDIGSVLFLQHEREKGRRCTHVAHGVSPQPSLILSHDTDMPREIPGGALVVLGALG